MHADAQRRPRNAIRLRNEAVLVDFLEKLEDGVRPCDLVRPPFEDEKDTQIRELKEEMAIKDRKIADLENRLVSAEISTVEIGQKNETIQKKKEVKKILMIFVHPQKLF